MDPSVEALLEEAERDAQALAKHKARKAERLKKNPNNYEELNARPQRDPGFGYGEPMEAPRPSRKRTPPEPQLAPRPSRNNTPPEYISLAPSADDKQRSSSNSNRYSVEREENDKRRSRRSHELDNDERRNSSSQGSANGSVRSNNNRRRSRSPARPPRRSNSRDRRDRDYRSRDYRDHDRRDRPSSGDYYKGDGRAPASNDDRYRPGRNEPPRRDTRSPPRYFDRPPRGGGRPRSPDRRRNKTPEPTDDERDRRTVFVQQLAARLRTKELKTFFEQVGPVVEAQIVKDRISQRSKGVGYVEFAHEESVQKAIDLTGQQLLGIPIIAQLTEAEKNRQARNTEGTATQSNGIPFHRLYVGNIHFSIHEDDLKNIFEPFGELEFVQLQKEEQGRSKGYGFVQFIDPAQAKEALEKMNGFELAGRPIRVGLGNDKFTPESTQKLLHGFSHQNQNQQGSSFSGMGGRGAHAGGTANFDRASGRDADRTGGASALDDTDVTGVNFSNFSRDSLMRKLARIDEPEQKVAPKTQVQSKTQVEEPAPSRCVLIKHMFDPAEETEPGWQKELERDVREECEDKYGHVVHIGVGMESNEGEVYVKFDRTLGGTNAVRGLNGRWFGGRILAAQYMVEAVYNINFPKAANV